MEELGLHEDRTRVTCHLPYNTSQHAKAFKRIIRFLRSQRRRNLGVTGYTHSSLRPTAFTGYWWGTPDDRRNEPTAKPTWVADKIVTLTVDYKVDFGDERIAEKTAHLKENIESAYAEYGCKQEEVWIVAQAITRHA